MLFICNLSFLIYQLDKFYQISQNVVYLQIVIFNLSARQILSNFAKRCLSANYRFQFISSANFIKSHKMLFICELSFLIYQPDKFYQISQNVVYLQIIIFNLSVRQILSNLTKCCLSANCSFQFISPTKLIKSRKTLFICKLSFSNYLPYKFCQISQNAVYLQITSYLLSF